MAYESREKLMNWIVVAAVFFLALGYFYQAQQGKQILINIQQPGQPQVAPQPVPTPTPVTKLVDTARLVIFAMDPEANPITNGTVELWKVTNVSKVTEKAFYATEGYSVWMNKSLDNLGIAEFTISRAQWDIIKQLREQLGLKIYAVVIPGGNYYRAGEEVPELSFYEGNSTTALKVIVPPIAQYYDLYNPSVDIRGLKSGDERSKEYKILALSENEKGVLKVYKFVVVPGALSNLTAQFDYLKIKVGDKEVELIKDGNVQLSENEEVIIPVRELKAADTLAIIVEYKLSADPNASLDGTKIADIEIYDVRDANVGTVSVTLNTA